MKPDREPVPSRAYAAGAKPGERHPGRTRRRRNIRPTKHGFEIGDHVEWNSEAGRVRGTIKRRVTAALRFKTYTVRASEEEPQYLIKSDKSEHLAMHKGAALKRVSSGARALRSRPAQPKKQ